MCGRIGLPQLTWEQFLAWQRGEFDWDEFYRETKAGAVQNSWNVKPTQPIEVIYARGSAMVSTTARWWFVPHWHKGDVKEWKATTFNARLETAREKPVFRTAWAKGRCVIPAT